MTTPSYDGLAREIMHTFETDSNLCIDTSPPCDKYTRLEYKISLALAAAHAQGAQSVLDRLPDEYNTMLASGCCATLPEFEDYAPAKIIAEAFKKGARWVIERVKGEK